MQISDHIIFFFIMLVIYLGFIELLEIIIRYFKVKVKPSCNVLSVKDGDDMEFSYNKDTGIMSFYGSNPAALMQHFTLNTKKFYGYTESKYYVNLKFESPISYAPQNATGPLNYYYEVFIKSNKDVTALLETIISNHKN
jgi:hypothetical protein